MRCHMRDPAPMPRSWVRSVCWSPEHIQEHVELLVSRFSKHGPGAAHPGDLLGMQTLAPSHPSESAGLGSGPATWGVTPSGYLRTSGLDHSTGLQTPALPNLYGLTRVTQSLCKMGRRSIYPFAETVLHTGPSVCLRNVNPKAAG